MKKFRIVNKTRFFLSSLLIFIFIILLFNFLIQFNQVSAANNIETIDIRVKKGDTVWEIAKKFKSKNEDTRKMVYLINEINDLNGRYLQVDETIKVPKYNKAIR
ncbi:MAG: LysM peptidoglycan-binding domain-containing protein [Bacillota bacterium]